MSANESNRNEGRGLPIQLDESPERGVAQGSTTTESTDSEVAEPQVAKSQSRDEPAVVPASGFATHSNIGRLTRHPDGFEGLWSGLADKYKPFPAETLIVLPQTLTQFVRGEGR